MTLCYFSYSYYFMFKIEKNIPLPTTTQDAEKYPFSQMDIGDSFIASTDFNDFPQIIIDVEKRNEVGDGRLFHFATTCDHDNGISYMLRIWRVSLDVYLETVSDDECNCLNHLIGKLNDGPMSKTDLAYSMRSEKGTGSVRFREKMIQKYDFLFKKTPGRNGGTNYEIA